jgi:tetratricopeptide (TPR) repeat protein
VVSEAVAQGDPAFLAEAQLVEGFILLRDSQVERAEARLAEAFRGALGHDAGKVALEAATSLAYLVGVKKAQSEAGLWLGSTAEALADRHDPRGLLEAEALTVIAQVLAVRGQYPEAEQRYREALEIFAARVGDHHLALVVPLNGLGQVLRNQQQLDEALTHYQRALLIRIEQLGDRHPQTAYQRMSLGKAMMERSELAAADDHYQQALEVLAALPAERELLADLHANLGVLRGKQGRVEEGEQELRLAVEHWEALYGQNHRLLATGRMNLGANLQRRERYEPAAEQYELALSILEHNEPTPANDEVRIAVLRNLGDTRKAQGRPDEAEPSYRRALELLERLGKARGVDAARLHNRMGELYLARGRSSDAVREHEAALAILEAMPRPDPFDTAKTMFHAGQALHAAGRPELALSHVERALELGRAHAGEPGLDADRLAEYSRLRAEIAEMARPRGHRPP